ncbi:RNA polymerase I-specific transcription initiation factor Rrn3p [[Candida] anglica]|uniref:RNA polymerase I-specific transcription initiation factor Rrn3p n=1 Tax=[Candida] anglica TaxID=148631 RepID=A0ABP0EB34_9ASCO
MMVSVQEPLSRKRQLVEASSGDTKRIRNELNADESNDSFSEKMYSAYVKSALDSLDMNETLQIDTLASKIRLPRTHREAISIPNFNITLKMLISNISKLDNKACNSLIMSVLEYKWLKVSANEQADESMSEDHVVVSKEHEAIFIDLYSHFLSILVSSLPKYLHDVTTKLITEFVVVDAQNLVGGNQRHHNILNRIIKFIPTSVNSLPGALQKNFPHHLASSTSALTNYVSNLLQILTYCPELQYDIWQMVIECCIKLDVELQNELDDLDDEEIEELINGNDDEDDEVLINQLSGDEDEGEEDEDKDGDDGSDSEDEGPEGEVEYLMENLHSTSSIKKISIKLDSIITLLLRTTESSFTVEELNDGNGVYLFNTLTSLFKTHILPTHFTKSIQFTLFHISQYQPELADSFLVLLIDVAFNTSEILEKRLKAMQYLSSYIARAKNLSRHQIVFVVSYLIGWLNKYVIERECEVFDRESDNKGRASASNPTKGSNGGMERFKLFYAAFQALLYIFCFRYKMLYKIPDSSSTQSDSEWECELDKFFQRAMIAKFNPLKFCDETVVYIFAKIATKLNVCYCYSIIEHNKRERMLQTNGSSSLPSAVSNFKQKQEFLDLEAYFPFDPIVLPTSKKIISQNYVEWADVNPSNEDDDEGEDSGSHQDMDSDDEEITSDEDL